MQNLEASFALAASSASSVLVVEVALSASMLNSETAKKAALAEALKLVMLGKVRRNRWCLSVY